MLFYSLSQHFTFHGTAVHANTNVRRDTSLSLTSFIALIYSSLWSVVHVNAQTSDKLHSVCTIADDLATFTRILGLYESEGEVRPAVELMVYLCTLRPERAYALLGFGAPLS